MSATESTGFLYPFIGSDERDAGSLLVDLAASARAKATESAELQRATLRACAPLLAAAAAAMADRFLAGGRMYVFGNGGSASDAATLAALFARPFSGRPLPALDLAADQAVVTALGNDVGFELVFSRQIIAHADADDIAVAISTSGNSSDLLAAVGEASRRGLLTIGFAGYDGGPLAATSDTDFCFVVSSQSVHRIQETQALLAYELWASVQEHLNETSAPIGGNG